MDEERAKRSLLCPNCGKPMRFVRAIPGIGALPELWSFECRDCAEAVTEPKAKVLATEAARAAAP